MKNKQNQRINDGITVVGVPNLAKLVYRFLVGRYYLALGIFRWPLSRQPSTFNFPT
jgi:hypothetical protein